MTSKGDVEGLFSVFGVEGKSSSANNGSSSINESSLTRPRPATWKSGAPPNRKRLRLSEDSEAERKEERIASAITKTEPLGEEDESVGGLDTADDVSEIKQLTKSETIDEANVKRLPEESDVSSSAVFLERHVTKREVRPSGCILETLQDVHDGGHIYCDVTQPTVKCDSENQFNNNNDSNILSETSRACTHQCVRPPDYNRLTAPGTKQNNQPAKIFSYPLDPFQVTAIRCLEGGECVLVSAHTSAGKTSVAEYAIAMAMRDKEKVVYTSPIKALSNQKYRDLSKEFGGRDGGNVGLMTGDTTVNPNASVVVMTTEILRALLFRGSELVQEVKWVIFDEIHYMRDKDRGVVWEETLVLLRPGMRQVFLSATIPNGLQFAEWICRIKNQPCHVVSTLFRPTPLQHFVCPVGGDSVTMVMDENRNFKEENFRRALSSLSGDNEKIDGANVDTTFLLGAGGKRKKGKLTENNDIQNLVILCHERNYTPLIVFGFAKQEIESMAVSMKSVNSRLNLVSDDDVSRIESLFSAALGTLSDEDKCLPQVESVLPLLRIGVGIHHGGLLPIVKEVTELLFQESLLKVLFSTETFSMGINMPAKTVIFSGIKKFDGVQQRLLSPGEYVQMSGRAGRRGLDHRGLSIVLVDEQLSPAEGRNMFVGEPLRLDSQFTVKYNSLLNLLRIEGTEADSMLQRSFLQFQTDCHAVELKDRLEEKKKMLIHLQNIDVLISNVMETENKIRTPFLSGIVKSELESNGDNIKQSKSELLKNVNLILRPRDCLPESLRSKKSSEIEKSLSDAYRTWMDICAVHKEVCSIITSPDCCAKYIQEGRIVHIVDDSVDWGVGICVSKIKKQRVTLPTGQDSYELVFDVALECEPNGLETDKYIPKKSWSKMFLNQSLGLPGITLQPNGLIGPPGTYQVVSCSLKSVSSIAAIVANLKPNFLDPGEIAATCSSVFKPLRTMVRDNKLTIVNPSTDMGITDADGRLTTLLNDKRRLSTVLAESPFYGHPFTPLFFEEFKNRVTVETEIRRCEAELSQSIHPQIALDLDAMLHILKRLGFITNNFATVKGRSACDISTADELVATELLFNSQLETLEPEYLAALFSCLVCEDESVAQPPEDKILLALHEQVIKVARGIAETSLQCRLTIDPVKYLEKFRPSMMQSVLLWVRGASFATIMGENKLYEGNVVRSIRRLLELLRELQSVCHVNGMSVLEAKLKEAVTKMKRGIAFAASLYL